jgi:hypothetical protein
MKRLKMAALVLAIIGFWVTPSRAADDAAATAVIDRAVKELGGSHKLRAVNAMEWSSKGTITVDNTDNPFSLRIVLQGLDHRRVEFDTTIGGNPIKGVVIVDGDKGWRQVNGMTEELSADELANERRNGYMEWAGVLVLPLKAAPFSTESAGEERVNDRPAKVIKITGPDGKKVTAYFDSQTGLPARFVATVADFGGEATHETFPSDYKDFGGIKRAKKVKITRDGAKFIDAEVTEFKVLDAPDTSAFPKPG